MVKIHIRDEHTVAECNIVVNAVIVTVYSIYGYYFVLHACNFHCHMEILRFIIFFVE